MKRQLLMKLNFVFLISLVLFINTESVMAAGDFREVINECKIVTIKGAVIEGKFIDSVAYNQIQPPPCDKNRIANKTIYRNAYTYNMLPISRILTNNRDNNNTLRCKVFVSDKDLVKFALSDIVSSAGFAPDRIIGDIPFVILSDRAMQLLIQKTPYVAYLINGGDISVISFNIIYDDVEKLKKLYWKYEKEYLQNVVSEYLGYEKLRQELESKDIVFIKLPMSGD